MAKLIYSMIWAAVVASLQDPTVPVEAEPRHKTVFKNEYVQAFRVRLPPGESTLMHIHSRPDASVRLTAATVATEVPGQPAGPGQQGSPGAISARENGPKPLTHRVHNVGATPFEVIDVQVLQRPDGPESHAIGKVAAENSKMRVYRYELSPGGSTSQHTHSRPYLRVAATDGALRMTSPESRATEHSVKAGDLHWVDSAVTHTLTNRGATTAIVVELELK
jgi:quercetin dioxygenase-like cupin family protein